MQQIPDDPDTDAQDQRDHERELLMDEAGARAAERGIDPTELLTEEFLSSANDLDVDRDLPAEHPRQHNTGEKLGAHDSKQIGLGNITRKEFQAERDRERGRRRLMNMTFRRPGLGNRCVGRVRERLTGGDAPELPALTPDLDDQLDAAIQAKIQALSGSIDARRWRGIAEMIVVNRTSDGGGASTDGVLDKVTGRLLGS